MGGYSDAWKDAWSIENMKAHGADGRNLRYIETRVVGKNVMHLYKDVSGNYWYRSEATEMVGEEMRRAQKRGKEAKQREAENRELEKKRLA